MADEYEVKEDQHSIHQDQEDIAVSPQQSNKDAVLEVIRSTSTEVDVRRERRWCTFSALSWIYVSASCFPSLELFSVAGL